MAHNLDDPEFWLPPLFLSDDDFKKTDFPLSDSNSGFSSPVDSSMGSESDEDGFLTELTRRLTSSTHLSPDLWNPKPNHGHVQKTDTIWKMPTSPQSTLSSERLEQNITRDYIHFWAPPQKQWLNSVAGNTKNDSYHSNQPNLYKPHQQNGNNKGLTPGLSPSAWPSLQQSQSHKQAIPVSWIPRAGVVSNNMTNGGCSGTGVFFPRPRVATTPTPTQTNRRKNPVASKQRNVSTQSQQRREMSRSHAAATTTKNDEIRLPAEWAY